MKYNDLTLRNFQSASKAGVLAGGHRGSAGNVRRAPGFNSSSRSRAGAIVDARFLVFGCPHTIAVAQWLAENVGDLPLRAQLPYSIAALRDLFAVPVAKLGRLLIIEDAWQAAVAAAIESASRAPTS